MNKQELAKAAQQFKSEEEFFSFLQEQDVELSDQELDEIAGGNVFDPKHPYEAHRII